MFLIHFTDLLKNTVEFLNEIYKIQHVEFQWLIFFKFLWNIFKDWIIYILTFQWIFSFVKYPIYVASWSESFFYDLIQNFFQNPPFSENSGFVPFENEGIFSFFSGFLNCFFLYLPFSPVHLIWLKRVLQKDEWSGLAASIGLICGNVSFLGFCLFGFRDFINLWFGFTEHFTYFFGVCLVFTVIFDMMHNPIRFLSNYPKKELFKIAIVNFLLVWTDQPGLYQFFGNLSISAGITPLDFSSKTIIFYFLGIIFGSFFWIVVIRFAIVNFGWILCYITKYKFKYPLWIRGLNQCCLIGSITLTLTSFPAYGFDYLFTSSLGFSPRDSIWEAIPTLPKLNSQTADTKKGRLGEKSSYHSVDVDLSLFDRGNYSFKSPIENHIESLNYKEEYAWRSRSDRTSCTSAPKGGGLLNQFFSRQYRSVEETMRKERQEKRKAEQLKRFRRLGKKRESLHFDIEDEPNFYTLETEFINYNQSLICRFIEDYAAEANIDDEEIPNLEESKKITFSAFSEIDKFGFDLFSIIETPEADPFDEELFLDLKQKYSEGFLYKCFLNFDISNFMKRQPYKLSSKDEVELFKKRLALNEYYNTLRCYSKLPLVFDILFCGPKSYSNRIYNQQFQGTLKFVERLFSIHLEKEENIKQNIILKPEMEKKREQLYFLKDQSVLKFDQPLYKSKKDFKNPLIHEQLMEYLPSLLNEVNSVPFIQEENPIPFFLGWDNEQHKFLVTNRFLTHPKILSNITLPKNESQKFFRKLSKKNEEKSDINFTFTSWPVSEQALQTNSFFTRLFRIRDDIDLTFLGGEDLFKYAEPEMEENIVYEKLPSLIERIDLKSPDKTYTPLAPKRGGFVWPGNFPLKFEIDEEILTPLLKKLGFLK